MKIKQNDLEHIKDLMQQGKLTADEANVEMVRTARVKLVTCKIPASVRKALNNAVKKGELLHMKKDKLKPEVYFHPNFRYMAINERCKHEKETVQAIKKICC